MFVQRPRGSSLDKDLAHAISATRTIKQQGITLINAHLKRHRKISQHFTKSMSQDKLNNHQTKKLHTARGVDGTFNINAISFTII